jgi:hypothetical protein
MIKNKQKILLFFLFGFSIYSAITVGESSDEIYNLSHGKAALEYLFSIGRINNQIYYGEFYSPIYWSLLYLLSKIAPLSYQVEATHLINLFFSFFVIFGLGKLTEELFNKKVGQITFLVLFFYPIFFGHMAFNNKDIIISLCHIWIFYLILKYLKKQNIKEKSNNYVLLIGFLTAVATGIQLVFLGSLITVFLFILFDIFLLKKFTIQNFNKKKFLFDLLKAFIVFYFFLSLFWIETHNNIFKLQFNFFFQNLSDDVWRGWPYTLVNGKYYFSLVAPKLYFLLNFIFKSPEYFLLSYLIFIFTVIKIDNFYKKKFSLFYYKLFLIISILLLPTFILFIVPFPIYDGMRLFLWSLPYFCIIPGLTIYYLMENIKIKKIKIIFVTVFVLFFYSLYNFVNLTPYQYTYLNIFNGIKDQRYKKFESDYWGVSLKELIKKSYFLNENKKLTSCGINNTEAIKYYLNKNKFYNIKIVNQNEDYDFIIMTNRITWGNDMENLSEAITCFDKFKGKDISTVERNGLLISTIREK